MILQRILCVLIGYVFGLFQTGYLYGKTKHIDIREHGSGNAGTTNTLRTLGWKAGIITFLGDLFKAILAVFVAWLLFHKQFPNEILVLEMYAGFGAVLGHNFPFYLGFKGGKGIACTTGFIIACFLPEVPVGLVLFILAVALTGYVSLGSILVLFAFMIQLVLFGELGILNIPDGYHLEVYLVGLAFTLMGLWRHRANIARLIQGKENKFHSSKKEDK